MDKFDQEIKKKLKDELKGINLSEEVVMKIHEQVKKEKRFLLKDSIIAFLNYEIKIPYTVCIAGAALAVWVCINSLAITDKDVIGFASKNIIEINNYWEELH